MRLHEPIIWRGRVLLAAGKRLTCADVDALGRVYPSVTARVGDPVLDEAIEFEDDSHDRDIANTAQQRIADSMSDVERRFGSRASLDAVNFTAIQQAVSEVVAFLARNPVSAALLNRCMDSGSYMSEHAGNVFYLSMLLGSAVREYVVAERIRFSRVQQLDPRVTMNLVPLGLGAMFMDIGMLPLQHLFQTDGPLSRDDRMAILQHPLVGADMLPTDLPPVVKTIVRSHHEDFEGTGYPDGLRGDGTHVFARIVRIADAYDAATAQHVYKEAKSSARAIWEMLHGPFNCFYDPSLMKVFSTLIQPFPIGAKLRLEDGRIVIVVKYNRRNPFLPTVVIAFGTDGLLLPQSQLEGPLPLEERPDLRVASFAGEDLSFLYEAALEGNSKPVRGEISTLFDAAYP